MKYLRGGYIEKNLHGIISVEVTEGTVTLVSGAATVSNPDGHSTTNILVTLKSPSGTLGGHYRAYQSGGNVVFESVDTTGSVVTTDTSVLNYVIMN